MKRRSSWPPPPLSSNSERSSTNSSHGWLPHRGWDMVKSQPDIQIAFHLITLLQLIASCSQYHKGLLKFVEFFSSSQIWPVKIRQSHSGVCCPVNEASFAFAASTRLEHIPRDGSPEPNACMTHTFMHTNVHVAQNLHPSRRRLSKSARTSQTLTWIVDFF